MADDVAWAGRTVAALGSVEHHVIPAEEMPLVFQGVGVVEERLDEPCSAAERGQWFAIARRAAARGRGWHLTGFGGTSCCTGPWPTCTRWPRPPDRLHDLRGFAARYRWPRGKVVRQLSDTAPISWLARAAGTLSVRRRR